MNFEDMISRMTPVMHRQFKSAIETGRWPDGSKLTDEQRAICMEAVMTYDAKFLTESERVGYIDRGSKAENAVCDDQSESPLKWS